MLTQRTFKYRIYPTRQQEHTLRWTLTRCRELYNAALQERRDAYRMAGVSIRCYDQITRLPEIKQERPDYADIHSQVLQDVLHCLEKAMHGFFRRIQAPGYPRFQGRNRYDSFTYPQAGFALAGWKQGTSTQYALLTLSKLGDLTVRLHRAMRGHVKTCTIKRECKTSYGMGLQPSIL
jgi:putative transposase